MRSKIVKTGLYASVLCGHAALKLDKQGSVKAAKVAPKANCGFKSGRAQCTRLRAHADKMDRQSCQTIDSKVR